MGLAGTKNIPTEEVIHILVNLYKSSERNQEVQNEVVVLSKNLHDLLLDSQIENT